MNAGHEVSALCFQGGCHIFGLGISSTQGTEFLSSEEFSNTLCIWYLGRQTETKGNIEMATCISDKRCTGRMVRLRGGILDLFCG